MRPQEVVCNPLEVFAHQGVKIELDSRTLLDYLRTDRNRTFEEGYQIGLSSRCMLSKKQAAAMLNVSERTMDNLRKSGELESCEYCNQVFFSPKVIEKYISDHTNLYFTIYNNMQEYKKKSAKVSE